MSCRGLPWPWLRSSSEHRAPSIEQPMIPAHWQRQQRPILSADSTAQPWCRVQCMAPHVIHHDGAYHMWYVGNRSATRTADLALGYAHSRDGLTWTEHDANPILLPHDLPFGQSVDTPDVLFDQDEDIYKMWLSIQQKPFDRNAQGTIVGLETALAYATSRDGLAWRIHPEPLLDSSRSPSVLKLAKDHYRMWMNSRPTPEHGWDDLYRHIYVFDSPDGIRWIRRDEPALRPTGPISSCVYPFVLRNRKGYHMWFGGHLTGRKFGIFYANSPDGLNWTPHLDRPTFAASEDPTAFDGRYTSMPCVLEEPDRFLLYYAARDWRNEYVAGDGTVRTDREGRYADIGVAIGAD